MAKKYEVVAICNALVDILVQAEHHDLSNLGMRKGTMHLVDELRQNHVLSQFTDHGKTMELGGSALNAIRSLAALGASTCFAGMVGEDDFGKEIQSRLEELGVHGKLVVSKTAATGSCLILITPDGERTMNTNLGASSLFDEALVPHAELADSQIFHFCGYQWDSDGQKRAIREAIAIAKANKTLISFDAADPFVCERNGADFHELIRDAADIVFANRDEARILYGTPEDAATAITATGATAVIKLGSEGALIGRGSERLHVRPEKVAVIDTTAAGDMYAAGFLYGMARDLPLATCGAMATTLAADVISRIGARVSAAALDRVLTLERSHQG